MAARLSLKLGVVSDRDRLADSPDTVLVVEPTIGSVARSKGSLYVLVTSTVPGTRARDATRLAAETIRDEYYYDESAGIRVCLQKVVALANKRLAHHRDKLSMGGSVASGPVGVAVAVVRGGELYVGTTGPAEAFLIRGARLSTLPDPDRSRGLPTDELELEVWRGEMSVGDSLLLVSPAVAERLGTDELKDALVTLHPQPAIERIHDRYVSGGGSGSDGMVAFEASEITAIARQRSLVPVRPDEPLAGMPDRSPIPLADSVTAGAAAMTAGASRARDAAGGVFGRTVAGFQDLLPRRTPTSQRVTPYATRQETQRRAAVALLAFVVVAGGLGFSVWLAGGTGSRGSVASLTAGQTALEDARDAVEEVWSPGVDLVTGDPGRARELLEEAYGKLDEAEAGGIPARTVRPLRERVVAGLDELFGVVEIRPSVAFAFPATTPPTDMGALARGPDQRWYVIDRSAGTVIRIETQDQTAVPILRAGDVLGDVTIAKPKLLTTGGPDLLILDEANNLWRWRPADTSGRATLSRVRVVDSASWGDDIRAIGTFCRNADCSLYNLYVVDPSENQIMTYSPAADGSGYPGAATGRLATARDVSTFDDLYIDGDIFVVDDGTVERFVSGRDDGWHTEELDDEILRPGARFDRVHSGAAKRAGLIYAYDKENARLVGYDKIDGAYVEQYRLVGDDPALDDVRGMWVVPGIEEGPDTFVWVDRDRLMYSLLEQAQAASPAPSASAVPSGSVLPSGAPASGAPASPSPAAP